MLKKIHPTLLGMWLLMVVYGLVLQMIILSLGKQVLYASIGAWAGVAVAMILAGLMLRSILGALDREEKSATYFYYKQYALRVFIVVTVFAALSFFKIGSVLTAFIGFFSLKIAGYLQPVLKKHFWTK